MATLTISVPGDYGYVLLTAATTMVVSMWHGFRVGPFRKAAKLPYPNAYASPEQIASATTAEKKKALYLFNCAQRAHYNFLENYVGVLPAILVSGLSYPKAAALLGSAWTVFRVVYALGYTSKTAENGKGRLAGSGFWLAQLGLFGLVGSMGYNLVSSK